MRRLNLQLVSLLLAGAALVTLSGCLAPPKPHPWQAGREELAEVRAATSWVKVSTNDYVRVPDERRLEAVALLEAQPLVPLTAAQASTFAPFMVPPDRPAARPYLIRGTTFSFRPAYTVIRWQAETHRLWVQQFTYNGEMLWPTRWIAEPNAFVIYLDRTPAQIIPDAPLGGDWIFRGSDWRTADLR